MQQGEGKGLDKSKGRVWKVGLRGLGLACTWCREYLDRGSAQGSLREGSHPLSPHASLLAGPPRTSVAQCVKA